MNALPSAAPRLRHGDHSCGVYRTDEDHQALILDFVGQGVEENEKIFYIVNLLTAARLRSILEEGGIAVEPLMAKGQLVVLTAKQAYLRDGDFDPDRMIALLRSETEKALAEGYRGLRVTGEMNWALSGEAGSERLVEYEAKLNTFFPSSSCKALCQYDQRHFDAEALLDILHTHPRVLIGRQAHDNAQRYYVPPERFLSPDRQGAVLEQWLENLRRSDAPRA